MPSVESFLTRELDLRFIDARTIATEARVSLGIEGYPNMADKGDAIRMEAIRIFENKADVEKEEMRRMKMDLETLKSVSNSNAMSDDRGGGSLDGRSIRSDTGSSTSSSRRRGEGIFGFLRRR